jgi:hypothetical protein
MEVFMNLIYVIIISQVAAQATHALALTKYFGSVRASSFLTLIFIGLTSLFSFPEASLLQAAFLGSSFIGMTDPERLSRLQIFFASVIFSLIFYFLLHYLKGPGGILGFSAFVSCLLTHFVWQVAAHPRLRFRRPEKF